MSSMKDWITAIVITATGLVLLHLVTKDCEGIKNTIVPGRATSHETIITWRVR